LSSGFPRLEFEFLLLSIKEKPAFRNWQLYFNLHKVHRLLDNRNIAIAGAGTLTFITKAINEIRRAIEEKERKENRKLEIDEIIDLSEGVLATIHKSYNIERIKYLYENSKEYERKFHFFTLLLGGVEEGKKRLCILHQDGIAETEESYAIIGSGAAYAEYLLGKLYDSDISTDVGRIIVLYTISEVERIDPNVGGPIHICSLTSQGCEEMSIEEIQKIRTSILRLDKILSEIYRKALKGDISEADLEKIVRCKE